ncbi:MAG: NUDIX hydrolase [Bacteroidales bacterium]|nr:NUDIX hydrolase [Bacteroidales bacterium]
MPTPKRGGYRYDYPRPALTVDLVLVTRERMPRVLLIQRKGEPFAGAWALPGGFVNAGEGLAEAAQREMMEETGVTVDTLEQLYTAGDPGRDPRGWTISVVFLAQMEAHEVQAVAGDDAAAVRWFRFDQLPELAFDHAMILERARIRIQDRQA